jgi:hypothetical protein
MNTTSAMMASTIRIVTSENVTVNARGTRRIIDQYAVTGRAKRGQNPSYTLCPFSLALR